MRARLLFRTTILSLACAALPAAVHAAGMDCKRAATATEKAICADPALVERDARMGDTYAELMTADPSGAGAEREAQRVWLQYRNKCGANTECLRDAYDTRYAVLSTRLQTATAYKPDDTDRQAAEDLRAAIAARMKTDLEFPLQNALKQFQIAATEMTEFRNEPVPNSDNPPEFPRKRPKGVTAEEWRALKAVDIVSEGENGQTSYALIDLDGDGKRDLIVDDYIGGTGLFTYVSTSRQAGGKFVDGTPMYSLNGRGGNQDSTWVRLRGRIYAAYRVGYYGEDTVYLKRALKFAGKVPAVTVRYQYDLHVPKQQAPQNGKPVVLDDKLHAALVKALPKVEVAQDRDPDWTAKTPICPVPAGTKEDEAESYRSFGPGHYSFEIVADFPVQKDGVCYIGRLMDWFGGYDKDGLAADYLIRRADNPEADPTTYSVRGKRKATAVTTSEKLVEGDNGI
jgi:uncharacterized protein